MKQYIELVNLILKKGTDKKDRTGTGTKSYFGHQMRFDMKNGFPLLVLKNTHWKSIVIELLWFLRGDTNIKYLIDNGVSIWNEWPYQKFKKKYTIKELGGGSATFELPPYDYINEDGELLNEKQFAERIKNDEKFAKLHGELGPVYGKQWIDWNGRVGSTVRTHYPDDSNFGYETTEKIYINGVNQIQNAVDTLKNNPDSRRIIVSAWNVGEIESMALPPCHAFFQFITTELTFNERLDVYHERIKKAGGIDTEDLDTEEKLDRRGVPKRKLSLQLYQRSCDVFLGVPFNVASYSLLLHMMAQCVNMIPDEFIWTGGDVHLYSNHMEQTQELLKRWDYLPVKDTITGVEKEEPVLPTLKLNKEIKNIFDFKYEDIIIENYNPMGSIKAPVAV